jgi:hypothetical protein
MDEIEQNLSEILEQNFTLGLKNHKQLLVVQCLRAYAALDKSQTCHDVYRRHFVKPYMKTITAPTETNVKWLPDTFASILHFIATEMQ